MQRARSQSGGTDERIRVFFIGKKITFKCLQSLKMFCQITKKRFQQPKITTEKPSPENFFLNFIIVFQGEGAFWDGDYETRTKGILNYPAECVGIRQPYHVHTVTFNPR